MKYSSHFVALLATASIALGQADPTSRSMNVSLNLRRRFGEATVEQDVPLRRCDEKGSDFLCADVVQVSGYPKWRYGLMAQLGFKTEDVKILLNSHAHFDHAGGLAELKQKSGAKLISGAADADLLRSGGRGDFRFGDTLPFPPVQPDQIIRDGESIQLGEQVMTAHSTPGHTKGNTTRTTKILDSEKNYNVVFVGSQSSLDYRFVGQESYPGIRADFEKSFARLKALPCDIFLGSHGSFFNFLEKRKRLRSGESNAFVDPDGYKRYLMDSEKDFREKLAKQENKSE